MPVASSRFLTTRRQLSVNSLLSNFDFSEALTLILDMVDSDDNRLTSGRPRPATYKTLNAMP